MAKEDVNTGVNKVLDTMSEKPQDSTETSVNDEYEQDVAEETDVCERPLPPPSPPVAVAQPGAAPPMPSNCATAPQTPPEGAQPYTMNETLLIFDWDDTVLPSTWVQHQKLRLDEASEVTAQQREQLNEVATCVAETLRQAKQYGKVVLVTNAEKGWIELSCKKFLPTLYPVLEGIEILSARSTYETPQMTSPLDWKLRAFESEICRVYGSEILAEPTMRKNVLSLGDSVHEREALMRSTALFPNCLSKSLKFVERPDISQIIKQHQLVTGCFNSIVHHVGNLDLLIRCN